MSADPIPASQARLLFTLIVCGTVLGIAGTDLVLPAVPQLPAVLGGTLAQAQLVLASFVGGSALGLLGFGELGARHDQRWLLICATALFALTSFAASLAQSIEALIMVRALQGASGVAAAVFAPGLIKAMYPEAGAVRALGVLGSIEALVPAFAPLAGAWLLTLGGWRLSFVVLAALALLLSLSLLCVRRDLFHSVIAPRHGSYPRLLRDRRFVSLALSQAFTLGGLLVFVFGAPAVFVHSLGGSLADFVIMQVAGITLFVVGANLTGHAVARFGADRTIFGGSLLSALGLVAILAFALAGGRDPRIVTVLFVPVNLGLGLRGPPGFFQAVHASQGDDSRGAALVILAILGTAALGTALVAPLIQHGLVPLAVVASAISCSSVLILATRTR